MMLSAIANPQNNYLIEGVILVITNTVEITRGENDGSTELSE